MDRSKLIIQVVLIGLVTTLIAWMILAFIATLLFPVATDVIYGDAVASNLIGVAVILLSVGLGAWQGFRSWKRYKKNSEDNSLS